MNDNGLSEILAIDENRAIVVERADRNASEGFNDWDFNICVYLVDFTQSTNITGMQSLTEITKLSATQPVQKRLLIGFARITEAPDCIETVTFGPDIDGIKSLLFVSDNNFQPYQSNKFYLFLNNQNLLTN